MARNQGDDFKFEITEHVGILSEYPSGWKKELNYVSYNGAPAKLDLRDWDENHEKMKKGITFTKEEAKIMKDLLNGLDLDE